MAAYEKQMNAKIAAENKFYVEQLAVIRKHVDGDIDYDKLATTSGDDEQTRVKQTLLYGRIRFDAQRQARLSAAKILDGNGSISTEVINLIDLGIAEDVQYARDLHARSVALRIDHIAGLAKLEYAKDDLATVRRQLATVAADQSTEEQLKALASFGKALRTSLNKSSK
jgi:hypothetical protein